MRLSLSNISGGYGRVEVLRDIELTVPTGSVVALLGANGAGKTTLLRIAAGLLRPWCGQIFLDDVAVEGWRPNSRARTGLCLIPEGRGVFRRLTVRENIAMQVGGRGLSTAVEHATHYFPVLGRRLSQQAGTLSGGEQQMLAVTRALITEAQLVIADELSLGLAPVVMDEIFDAVARLRESGRSLLIVEQYVERVLALADYVYILHKGRVVFVGEPSQCSDGSLFERYVGATVDG